MDYSEGPWAPDAKAHCHNCADPEWRLPNYDPSDCNTCDGEGEVMR
ncbi:hypothetical protein [Lentzea sp. NBRC 102530]|nr:hypothetical protein [Lentzea sp. NBRC 102530]